jgi:hypothetical protein
MPEEANLRVILSLPVTLSLLAVAATDVDVLVVNVDLLVSPRVLPACATMMATTAAVRTVMPHGPGSADDMPDLAGAPDLSDLFGLAGTAGLAEHQVRYGGHGFGAGRCGCVHREGNRSREDQARHGHCHVLWNSHGTASLENSSRKD